MGRGLRIFSLALLVAPLAIGCGDEESRQERLVRSVDVSGTSGGDASPVPELFLGRVGMSFSEIDAICGEAGGRFGVVSPRHYRCSRVQGPIRMQGSRTEEYYHFDASQRCSAAYYLVRISTQRQVRFRGHRLSPKQATRRMYNEIYPLVERTLRLRRVDGRLRVSSGSWVRVGIEEHTVFVEVGMPRPPES